MKENFGNEYLEKNIEPVRSKEEKARYTTEDLGYGAIVEHDKMYLESKGVFEKTIGNTHLFFSYSKPDEDEVLENINRISDSSQRKKMKSSLPSFVLENIRKIDNFEIRNSDKYFSSNKINEKGGPHIYFNVPLESGSTLSRKANTIFLEEDPLSRKGLVVLFHEFGHYSSPIATSKEDMEHYFQSLKKLEYSISLLPSRRFTKDNAARILEEERRAWAFGLKTLRPFENDLDLDLNNTIETVHGFCLQSYSDAFREKLKK